MGLPEFTRNQKWALLALIGLSAIGLSVNLARQSSRSDESILIEEPSNGGAARVRTSDSDQMPVGGARNRSGEVVFQVVGCVNAPGVYRLPWGSRVYEAIQAAGGARPDADASSINLAAKIEDGARINVPAKVAMRPAIPGGVQSAAASAIPASASGKLKTPGEGTVNINSASVEELQRLPGVGPVTAQTIMDYRRQIGRFTTCEQLMDVKGIGPKKLEKMRPFVSL